MTLMSAEATDLCIEAQQHASAKRLPAVCLDCPHSSLQRTHLSYPQGGHTAPSLTEDMPVLNMEDKLEILKLGIIEYVQAPFHDQACLLCGQASLPGPGQAGSL